MSVSIVVFAAREINLLSDTLKCLFSHLNSVWPAAHSLSELRRSSSGVASRYNHSPSEFGRLRREREASSSVFPRPSLCRSALEPLPLRVPESVVWAYLCFCDDSKWTRSKRFSEVFVGFLNDFWLPKRCLWSWSWRYGWAVAVRGPENYTGVT